MASTPLAGFKGKADLQDSNGSGILGWPRATVSEVRTGTESSPPFRVPCLDRSQSAGWQAPWDERRHAQPPSAIFPSESRTNPKLTRRVMFLQVASVFPMPILIASMSTFDSDRA